MSPLPTPRDATIATLGRCWPYATPRSRGVNRIEIRTIIAYLIIAAMVSAAIAGILYLRHNSPQRRYHRDRLRTAKNFESRNAPSSESIDDAPLIDPLHAENLR